MRKRFMLCALAAMLATACGHDGSDTGTDPRSRGGEQAPNDGGSDCGPLLPDGGDASGDCGGGAPADGG